MQDDEFTAQNGVRRTHRGRGPSFASVVRSTAACVAILLLLGASPAYPCVLAGPASHQVDSNLAATDTAPPAFRDETQVRLHLYEGEAGACRGQSSSCDGLGTIGLTVSATDDQSPPERIGYRLAVIEGMVPAGVTVPTFDTAAPSGMIFLPWIAEEGDDTFRFVLSLSPVDQAGNVGQPQRVVVQRDEGGACSTAPRSTGRTSAALDLTTSVLAMVFAIVGRRKRRPGEPPTERLRG